MKKVTKRNNKLQEGYDGGGEVEPQSLWVLPTITQHKPTQATHMKNYTYMPTLIHVANTLQ
jgi:hypothetical protein